MSLRICCGIKLEPNFRFFEYIRRAREINLNKTFKLAIKNIGENCATGKQLNNLEGKTESENNRREIQNLGPINTR